VNDADRERARRLIEAEAEVVGLRAEVASLKDLLERSEADLYHAERVADDVRTCYPRRVYVPGDDPPVKDHPWPTVVLALRTGAWFRQSRWADDEWQVLHYGHTTIRTWTEVLGDGPVIEVTGADSQRLLARLDGQEAELDAIRSLLWSFERDLDEPWLAKELGVETVRTDPWKGRVHDTARILHNARILHHRLRLAYRRIERTG
jgi:hypothetical protein